MRGIGYKLKYKQFCSNIRNKLSYCEGDQTLEQVCPEMLQNF